MRATWRATTGIGVEVFELELDLPGGPVLELEAFVAVISGSSPLFPPVCECGRRDRLGLGWRWPEGDGELELVCHPCVLFGGRNDLNVWRRLS